MAVIISASRRTDIPRYYAEFFSERRSAGQVEFRNAFGGMGSVSLRDEDVLAYLFWTRLAQPFASNLQALRDDGIPYAFQYTITGYDTDLEPYTPGVSTAIDDFQRLSAQLPDPACIQWRYDPIVISGTCHRAWHEANFSAMARQLQGATRVVNVSVVEPYLKAIRRVDDPTVQFRPLDPKKHRAAAKRHPDLPQAGPAATAGLLEELNAIAAAHGMQMRTCCNPELSLPASQCCSLELFTPYGDSLQTRLGGLPKAPSRESCRCLRSVDIGMDNTCVAGCRYCYVVTSHETAVKNLRRHDPKGSMLRPDLVRSH
ncbi:MAG: DUF1848 family protein [Gemmatimonadetes bacterium]|nr:DUF1848 family protein [Gemmatimonadota bacterium]